MVTATERNDVPPTCSLVWWAAATKCSAAARVTSNGVPTGNSKFASS